MYKAIPEEYWAGKSTKPKPTENVPENQVIIEKDTGKTFIFDKEDKVWYPIG